MAITRRLNLDHRARVVLIGTMALSVALVATAFAIGGSGGHTGSAGASRATASSAVVPVGEPSVAVNGLSAGLGLESAGKVATQTAPQPAPQPALHAAVAAPPALAPSRDAAGSGTSYSAASSNAAHSSATATDASSSVTATKIVKTGELTVRVAKSRVQQVTESLTTLAASQGGYVSSSSTNLGAGEPSGDVVLRIPVAHFDDAITAAEKLGHVLSLTTSADDVTGEYVDLDAKEHALQQTRSTYLSILSKATTIGATLSVQERIDAIQQQIDELHGQIKLLSNQSSYSTLTVDVVPVGAAAITVHHPRRGITAAWHKSWSRFGRGADAMVGAIGPIVLAVLLLILVGIVGALGYRGVRRVTS